MTSLPQGRYVISVLVADRVGILRDITSALTDMGANIDGISQTVVEGYFTVILTATAARPCSPEDIQNAILANFPRNEAFVVVRPHEAKVGVRPPVSGPRYIATITGKDQRGILKAVTGYFAQKGINIEDWYVRFEGSSVTHIGEITVPERLDIKQVQDEFQQVLSRLGLVSSVQHENIFIAANEIGPLGRLIGGLS